MKSAKLISVLGCMALIGLAPAKAQSAPTYSETVSSCGSQSYTAGKVYPDTQDTTGNKCSTMAIGRDLPIEQAVTIAASSHANNTCLGAIHPITLTNFVASGGGVLSSAGLRSSSGLTGNVMMVFFMSAPSATVCPTDGAAFAATDADLLLVPPGGMQTITLATASGGLTQSTGSQTNLALPIKVDAAKKIWVAEVNVSGGALTPALNGLSEGVGTYGDPN